MGTATGAGEAKAPSGGLSLQTGPISAGIEPTPRPYAPQILNSDPTGVSYPNRQVLESRAAARLSSCSWVAVRYPPPLFPGVLLACITR